MTVLLQEGKECVRCDVLVSYC